MAGQMFVLGVLLTDLDQRQHCGRTGRQNGKPLHAFVVAGVMRLMMHRFLRMFRRIILRRFSFPSPCAMVAAQTRGNSS